MMCSTACLPVIDESWSFASRDSKWPRLQNRPGGHAVRSNASCKNFANLCGAKLLPPKDVPMVPPSAIDDFLEAFERARAAGPIADLAPFAPPADHVLHASVLRELIRVDLEAGWSNRNPKSLAEYRRAYPT